jgi:hypothetical protein
VKRVQVVAAVVSFVVALFGLVALAPAAQAAVNGSYPTVYCQVNNLALANIGGIQTFTSWTITMSLSPANAAQGAEVTLTVSSAQTPKNGPAIALPAGGTRMEPMVVVGSTTVLTESAANAAQVPKNADIFPGGWTATGTFSAPAADGAYDAVLDRIVINSFSGSNTQAQTDPFDSICALDNNPAQAPLTPFGLTLTGTGGGGATSTPTPTTSSPTPTPTPTTSSPTPTPTPTTSSPTPTPTTSSPTPTPTATATPTVVNGLICEILGTIAPWEKSSPNDPAEKPDSASPTFTFAASTLNATSGEKVSLALSFDQGPQSGPILLSPGIVKPVAKIALGGSATGTLTIAGPTYGEIQPYSWIPGTTITGTWTATSSGPVTFTLQELAFDYGDPVALAAFDYPQTVDDLDTVCNKGATPKTAPVSIGLQAEEGAASVPTLPDTLPTSNGPLEVTGDTVAGGTVTLGGAGFAPTSIAVAGVYSTPVELGQATADASGAVSIQVVIPADLTGEHTLVLYGTDASGSQFALTKAVSVGTATDPTEDPTADPTDDTDNGGPLPQTGPEDFAMTLLWGLVALQIGLIIAVRATRSRRRPATARHRR